MSITFTNTKTGKTLSSVSSSGPSIWNQLFLDIKTLKEKHSVYDVAGDIFKLVSKVNEHFYTGGFTVDCQLSFNESGKNSVLLKLLCKEDNERSVFLLIKECNGNLCVYVVRVKDDEQLEYVYQFSMWKDNEFCSHVMEYDCGYQSSLYKNVQDALVCILPEFKKEGRNRLLLKSEISTGSI